MRIGEVASKAGVNAPTLRYYERRGILRKPDRRASGYREYDAETVRIVRFVKRAQELGFSLEEIEELLRLRTDRRGTCADVRSRAKAKLREIERKIESLRAMSGALETLLKTCTRDASARECPILECLEGEKDDIDDEAKG